MKAAVILFNRDLRVRDNPALAAAARVDRVLPLFVLDEALLGSRFAAPNRVAFLRESLGDLDESLRGAGARLHLRRGDPVHEALAVAREIGAAELHVSADWSAYVRRYLPALEAVENGAVHEPWLLEPAARRELDYPEPIVDHADAAAAFLARRA